MASGSPNVGGGSGGGIKPQLDNQLQMTTGPPSFHPKCGQLVTLCSSRRTATRSHAVQEFNHGLVFSHTPLVDNQVCLLFTWFKLSKNTCVILIFVYVQKLQLICIYKNRYLLP